MYQYPNLDEREDIISFHPNSAMAQRLIYAEEFLMKPSLCSLKK